MLKKASWTQGCSLATKAKSPDYPHWLLRTPVWPTGWTSAVPPWGPTSFNVSTAIALRELLGVEEMGLHWYGWNKEIFDTDYPHYAPRPEFAGGAQTLQAAGVHAVPYINGRLFDPHSPDWVHDSAINHTCTNATGHAWREKHDGEHGSYHNVSFYVMNPALEYWQEKMSNTSGRLAFEFNVDGVCIDQVASTYADPCRGESSSSSSSKGKGTRFGGGSAWADGAAKCCSALY